MEFVRDLYVRVGHVTLKIHIIHFVDVHLYDLCETGVDIREEVALFQVRSIFDKEKWKYSGSFDRDDLWFLLCEREKGKDKGLYQ